jgi:hypothetical protein
VIAEPSREPGRDGLGSLDVEKMAGALEGRDRDAERSKTLGHPGADQPVFSA